MKLVDYDVYDYSCYTQLCIGSYDSVLITRQLCAETRYRRCCYDGKTRVAKLVTFQNSTRFFKANPIALCKNFIGMYISLLHS